MFQGILTAFKKHAGVYFIAAFTAAAIKFGCGGDSGRLSWILAPTARWVELLSGLRFENVPDIGYVNMAYRFIIAPSCGGIRFLLIVFMMLVFSFCRRMETKKKGFLWLLFCLLFSYVYTVFVNGIRITVSIFLPLALGEKLAGGWLSPERLHTLIGTAVYFTALTVLYHLMGFLLERRKHSLTAPAFIYLLFVLGLPVPGRLYRNEWEGFGTYFILVTGVCAAVTLLAWVSGRIRKRTQ